VEITLRLERPALVQQIQLLSHEYKARQEHSLAQPVRVLTECCVPLRACCAQVATKVELYVGTLPAGETDLRRVVMRRLGHVSFDRCEVSLKHRRAPGGRAQCTRASDTHAPVTWAPRTRRVS